MTTKTLADFMEINQTAIVVVEKRYGKGYIAFVGYEGFIGKMAQAFTGGDEEYNDLCLGVMDTDWYPMGHGDTIEEAYAGLKARVEDYLGCPHSVDHWHYLFNMLYTRMYKTVHGRLMLCDLIKKRNLPSSFNLFRTISMVDINKLADKLDSEIAE